MIKYFFSLFAVLLIATVTRAQNQPHQKDSLAVAGQLNAFIMAFRNFETDKFESYFADDVTVFFPPSAMVPNRVEGKEKVIEVFRSFFQRVKQKVSGPPYLDITPLKLQINIYREVAVATFELDDKDALSRRTIVLKKIHGKYLIIHLHASKIDNPPTHN